MDAETGELDQVLQRTKIVTNFSPEICKRRHIRPRPQPALYLLQSLRGAAEGLHCCGGDVSDPLEQVLDPASYQVASKILREAFRRTEAKPGNIL